MSEAMKWKIGRILQEQRLDSAKIDSISKLFVYSNWSLAMITKLLQLTTDFSINTDLEQYMKFVVENNFNEKLTAYLMNNVIENIKEEAWFLQQLKFSMINYRIMTLINDKFENNSNLMWIGFK